jgi:hypothetical protein
MRRKITKIAVAVVVLVAVGAYWSTGRMDLALANLGLNATDCAQNGFGAMLCGDQLKAWKKEVKKEAEQAKADEDAQQQYEIAHADWQLCADDNYELDEYMIEQECGTEPAQP